MLQFKAKHLDMPIFGIAYTVCLHATLPLYIVLFVLKSSTVQIHLNQLVTQNDKLLNF